MTESEFLESLKDRDLEGIDSEYTFSTRTLVQAFNADGAHLNRWWVMTPVSWLCPCCKRTEALKAGQLKQWKIDNGYHQRSLAETAMGRYKQLNSPMLSLRDYNGQLQRHWPV